MVTISGRSIRRAAHALVALLAIGGLVVGCGPSAASKAQSANNNLAATEYQKFSQAVPYPYQNQAPTDPLERENLARRLQQYNSSGDTNYVYIETFGGQVIGYYVIRGKVSSTGSQMTSTQVNVDCGQNAGCTDDAIGDDGSFGPEEGGQFGVFFFTANGTLVETDNPFIVSSQPIKLYANVPQLDASAK
jgi:hypothetical protein